ncbi:hypothetical protein FHR81_004971 [Actinoalloteichus hoggarensis]|uniref:Glyoxalase-like domain protein n=1 Tax=Actinoalloteichus hoggarensis TaxID=1470176 RepID=A0A221W8M0_9PSEU|nr:glyoxalase/bleomycin resistance/extradiol dioxygenase family protein [Actinoalloteichus hoggarensis]ASO22021.1 Glyoxalase-like domain protein [Actinoalloteichus hoggarensis]MBB5923898.1 hypothetical protein [Actinoalloteichus hoggarensis]
MSPLFFVNLPVKELGRATAFYEALGFTKNPRYSDENASCMVVSETVYLMLLVEPFFATFTGKPVADAALSTEVILTLTAEGRSGVDRLVEAALSAGGGAEPDLTEPNPMYLRRFQDVDGHQWEVTSMDSDAAP